MPYAPDMRAAARRHLEAAHTLDKTNRRDVAGYLYGIAAECGVKALMQQAGFKKPKQGDKDPYYVHFPELKTLLRNKLQGRNASLLRKHISTPELFQGWDIKMRYCKGSQVPEQRLDQWKAQAVSIVGSIGT